MATLLCPRATCLRQIASTARTFPAPPAKACFSTRTTPVQHLRASIQPPTQPSIVCRIRPQSIAVATRHASSAPTASPTPSSPPKDVLTWNRFFDLRRKRRYVNLAASVATAAAAVMVGGPLMAQQDVDSWGAQISGLDPVMVLGLSTIAVAAAGWLCGPSFGSMGFGMWAARRGWATDIMAKEKSFYSRIKKYRSDPASSSPQNPIPDYYGEKIASVKDYRRWLKDQRAFKLKKNKNLF